MYENNVRKFVDFFFAGLGATAPPIGVAPLAPRDFGLRTLVGTGSRPTTSQTSLFQRFLHQFFLSGQINMKDLQSAK